MIELRDIRKSYDRTILNGINLKFESGKIYIVKGVSGCGKTTLLNILGLIDYDFSGVYLWDNQVMTNQNSQMNRVGYIFQNSLLISNMTIEDNLLFIKNDFSLIESYSCQLGIDKLLKKYPDELSGGERSRVAVIRALLSNPKLILADEPSASLDSENSKRLADIFSEISTEDNVIIISTHEDCFDSIADEIIHLDYGNIASIDIKDKGKKVKQSNNNIENTQRRKLSKYILRKNKVTQLGRNLLLSFMILLIFFSIGLLQNIQGILLDKIYSNYPMTTFDISKYDYENIKENVDLKLYENYQYKQDNFTCYILLNEKDSGFSFPGVLFCGNFPKNGNEVIINQVFANNNFAKTDFKDCIGKEIEINNSKFVISGILSDLPENNDLYNLVYYFDYYRQSEDQEAVYIPYNTLKTFGQIEQTEFGNLMVVCEDLYDSSVYNEISDIIGGSVSPWDGMAKNAQSLVNSVVIISLAAIFIIMLLSILFVSNEIKLDLYFRKREFGYLQIFGITKKEIMRIVFLEKVIQAFYSLIIASLLYFVVSAILKIGWAINIAINPLWIILVGLLVILYVLIVTYSPSKKFLKTNIVDLIK